MKYFGLMTLAIIVAILVTHSNAEPGPGGKRPGGKRPGGWGGFFKHHDCKSQCTCEDPNKEAVEVFTSTAAGALKSTICVDKQICYKICDPATCTTPTVTCVPAATATGKPGQCPTLARPYSWPLATAQCTDDSGCPGKEKCCILSPNTVAQCTEPVGTETKCGICPTSFFRPCILNTFLNEQPCTSDANCPSTYKCCTCGTSSKCMRPLPPFTAPAP